MLVPARQKPPAYSHPVGSGELNVLERGAIFSRRVGVTTIGVSRGRVRYESRHQEREYNVNQRDKEDDNGDCGPAQPFQPAAARLWASGRIRDLRNSQLFTLPEEMDL
jgi:hypothetical protein